MNEISVKSRRARAILTESPVSIKNNVILSAKEPGMATTSSAVKISELLPSNSPQRSFQTEMAVGSQPQPIFVRELSFPEAMSLITYTEHEIRDLLQVFLSQLRKWRRKTNAQNNQLPSHSSESGR